MKKVLVVTDLFHASPRIPGLCRYIKEFGWEPIVLATPVGENADARGGPSGKFMTETRIIEVPYRGLVSIAKDLLGFKASESSRAQIDRRFRRDSLFLRFLRRTVIFGAAILAYPDEMRAWRRPAVEAAEALLSREKMDAVLSSSSPVTSHRVAAHLKRCQHLPWLADLRDLWTQNHGYPYPQLRKLIETRLEIRTLSRADALSTVSESTANKLRSRYVQPVHVIPNGFGPETINDPPVRPTREFTITYTGSIYPGKQDPAKLFEALHDLFEAGVMDRSKVLVRLYGTPQPLVEAEAKRWHIKDVVELHPPVSRTDSFERQRESQVLLAYGWEDEYEIGVFPIKIFEYLAARRPILATGGTPKEQFRAMLDTTRAGRHAITVADIKTILVDYYRDYLRTGAVSYHGIPVEMDKYSYREMARKFAAVLNRITVSHGSAH